MLQQVRALFGGARKDDRVHVFAPPELLERLREDRVAAAVIEGEVRRRTEDDEDPGGVDAEPRSGRPRSGSKSAR